MADNVRTAQPLPNIEKKPRIAGVAGTILFWALFILLSTVFSLFARKPVYKTVQIRLDSPQPKTQEARAAAAPKSNNAVTEPAKASPPPPAPAQQTAPAQTAKPAQPKQPAPPKPAQSTPKPQPQKTAPAKPKPAPTKNPQPQKMPDEKFEPKFYDPMEQFSKNTEKTNKKKNAADINWDEVQENTSSSNANTAATVKEVAALSGSAASASQSTSSAATATSSKNSTSTAASSGTNDALSKIAATQYTKVSGNGVSSTATVKTGGTTDGKVTVQMSDGTSRALLDPATPSITLSRAVAALIDSKKQVQIRFTVTANGTVPVSEIRITPASILHTSVQSEITVQISHWRFSAADVPGTAVFDYTINVK